MKQSQLALTLVISHLECCVEFLTVSGLLGGLAATASGIEKYF